MATNGIKVSADNLHDLKATLLSLAKREVLVGFPEDTTNRDPSAEEPEGITNAALGYIHDRGAPEQNIPARPFMIPGMEAAVDPVADILGRLAKKVLSTRDPVDIDMGLHQAGLKAQATIRMKINEGVPPPLAEMTLRSRARKGRKGAALELSRRAQGEAPSTQFAKPLVDTGQLRNALNYVIRDRKKRRA